MGRAGPELLRWIVEEHGPPLVLYARQWCSTPEDAVQEALLKLFQQPDVPEELMPWLYRVVRNEAIAASRGQQRRRRRENRAARDEAWFSACETNLDAKLATEVLQNLPIELRQVIVAKLWGQLTFQQIADLCQSSVSTVHRRYHEGLEILRERLGVSWLEK